ncbi:MAG: hypothetical protein ACHQUC_07665 [Chlamydiales bacterium]
MLPKVWLVCLLIVLGNKEDFTFKTILFLAFCILAVFLSYDWTYTIAGSELMGFNGLIEIYLYWRIFEMFRSPRIDIGYVILTCSVPMLAYAVMQRLGLDYPHPMWTIPYHRAISTQGNPVFLSMLIGMIFPLAWHYFRTCKSITYFCLLAIMTLALWAAGSKNGWMAALVGIGVYELV